MMPAYVLDFPPAVQERVVCSIAAAARYQIPANIMLAVAGQEGGRPGEGVINRDGSADIGPMQFNTNYLAELRKYGIEAGHVAAPGCYAFELAAWRLRQHLDQDTGDVWTRAANYHSRTPSRNQAYRAALIQRAEKWAMWLRARFHTQPFSR